MNKVLQVALLTIAVVGVAAAGTPSLPVPEIDAAGAVAAVGLIGGVLLVVRARRRK